MNFNKLFNIKSEIRLSSRHFIFIGIGIFILNILVKSYRIARHSLWYDEIFSVFFSQQTLADINAMSGWDTNPPFYYYLLHFWIKLFGIESEATVRMLSVILSSFAGVMLFYFARKHINLKTAFLASIIFLFHGATYRYAQETRCFSFVILLSLISYHFFFNFLKTEKVKWFIFLGVVNSLLFYTHYVTIFFTIAQGIQYLLLSNHKKRLTYFLFPLGTIILLLLPWVKTMLGLIQNTQEGMIWITAPGWYDVKAVLLIVFQHELFIALAIIALLLAFIPKTFLDAQAKKLIKQLLFWSLGAITICFFISLIHPVFVARYFLYAVPGAILLVSFTATSLEYKHLDKVAFALISLFFILYFSPARFSSNVSNTKNNIDLYLEPEDEQSTTLYLVDGQPEALAYYLNKDWFKDYSALRGKLLSQNIVQISNPWLIGEHDFSEFKTIKLHQEFHTFENSLHIANELKNRFTLVSEKVVDNIKITEFSNASYDSSFSTTSIVTNDNFNNTFWEDTLSQVSVTNAPGDGKCVKLDPEHGFTHKHIIDFEGYRLTPTSMITVDCWVKQSAINKPIFQVIELKDKDGNQLYWGGLTSSHHVNVEDVWCHMHIEFPISLKFPKFDHIETYFWGNGYRGEALIDDVTIKISGIVKTQ